MQDFRRLGVWKRSHALTVAIHRLTASFPKEERFLLTSQIRRAAASVPANLAEGSGFRSDREFARFVQIALGSACEVEYHLLLAHDTGLLSPTAYATLAQDGVVVRRMLISLLNTLRASVRGG